MYKIEYRNSKGKIVYSSANNQDELIKYIAELDKNGCEVSNIVIQGKNPKSL